MNKLLIIIEKGLSKSNSKVHTKIVRLKSKHEDKKSFPKQMFA